MTIEVPFDELYAKSQRKVRELELQVGELQEELSVRARMIQEHELQLSEAKEKDAVLSREYIENEKELKEANRLNDEMRQVIQAALIVNALPIGTPRGDRERAELRFWCELDEYKHKTEKRFRVQTPMCGSCGSMDITTLEKSAGE